MKQSSFTAVLEKEGSEFVALCPELDVASQGDTIESAMANLREAVELFLECASPQELQSRNSVLSHPTCPRSARPRGYAATFQAIFRAGRAGRGGRRTK